MQPRRLWLLALVLWLVGTAPGWSEAGKRLSRQARAHVKAGLAHLDKGEHDAAIESFKIAYSLSNQPDILFDIGRAYELKDDRAQAIYYFTTFLEQAPKHKKRADAQQRIERLKAGETEPRPPPDPPPPDPPPPDPPPPKLVPEPKPKPKPKPLPPAPPEQPQQGGGRGLRIAGLATMTVGLLGLGAGGYYAWVARDKAQTISDLFADGATWTPEYDDLYADGRAARRNARILLGVGGAAVVGGTVLYLLGRSQGGTRVEVAPGGAKVSWACVW